MIVRSRILFHPDFFLRQSYLYGCPFPGDGSKADGMPQIFTDPFAKVQPDPTRPLIFAPVVARLAFLEHARQILRRYPDARITDTEYIPLFQGNGHTPALCIF